MATYRVVTPNPTQPAAAGSGLAKIFIVIVLTAAAVYGLRYWGESRLNARHDAPVQAAVSMQQPATVQATPTPTPVPTPRAQPVGEWQPVVFVIDGVDEVFRVRTVAGGVEVTFDGDLALCEAMPQTVSDLEQCEYQGTTSE